MKQKTTDKKKKAVNNSYNQHSNELPSLQVELTKDIADFVVERTVIRSVGWNVNEAMIGFDFLLSRLKFLQNKSDGVKK